MMERSGVTEYIINYLCENKIQPKEIAEQTGIPENKLKPGYKEPLLADEFLRLCVVLCISPEKIASELKEEKCE